MHDFAEPRRRGWGQEDTADTGRYLTGRSDCYWRPSDCANTARSFTWVNQANNLSDYCFQVAFTTAAGP